MARLIPALSYNFILLIKVKDTQFSKVMNVRDLVPYIGAQFLEFFPLLLIFFCVLNVFDVHTRIVNGVGLSQLAFSETLDLTRLDEGKSLIARARLDRERMMREANNYSARILSQDTRAEEAKPLRKPLRNK